MAYCSRIASAIQNDLYSGLLGFHLNLSISIEQLEDEVSAERLRIIQELILKNSLPKDLLISLNCVNVDCQSIEKCKCRTKFSDDIVPHFEIPLTIVDYGLSGLAFVGTTDKTETFTIYTSMVMTSVHKYRRRRSLLPYVYIDTTPNENNMFDCYIFNAPLIRLVTVIGLFKDMRLVEEFNCCTDLSEHFTSIDLEIQKRLTESKLRYYRQLATGVSPNDLKYK